MFLASLSSRALGVSGLSQEITVEIAQSLRLLSTI